LVVMFRAMHGGGHGRHFGGGEGRGWGGGEGRKG